MVSVKKANLGLTLIPLCTRHPASQTASLSSEQGSTNCFCQEPTVHVDGGLDVAMGQSFLTLKECVKLFFIMLGSL